MAKEECELEAALDSEFRRIINAAGPNMIETVAVTFAQAAIDVLGRIDTDHAKQTLRGLAARAERAAKHGTVTELDLFYGKGK